MSAVCPVYPQQQTSPNTVGTSHLCQKRSFDHLVGDGKQRRWDHETEAFGGSKADDELEPRGLLDGKISRLRATQYLVHEFRYSAGHSGFINAVTHQSPGLDVAAQLIHGRKKLSRREVCDLGSQVERQRVCEDHEGLNISWRRLVHELQVVGCISRFQPHYLYIDALRGS